MNARKARLWILAAAALWSTAGAAIKNVGLPAFQIAGGRAVFAALAVALFLPRARRGWNRRVLLVGAAYAATTVLFVWANTRTAAANAIFLQDLAPLWVLILSPLLLGEKPTRSELLAAPLYFGGAALFFLDELAPGQAAGNWIAIASGIAFAFLVLGLRKLRGEGSDAAVLAGSLLAVLCSVPSFVLEPRMPGPLDIALLGFLGVFQLGLAYFCFNRGLAGVSAVEASLLALLEPVLNPIWAFFLAGERPGPWAIAGGAVILGTTLFRVLAAPRA